MVKVTNIKLDPSTKKATVELFSDTKAEMSNLDKNTIIGFPKDYDIDFGSSVFTSSAELGFMQSDGTWNFGST